MKLLKWQKNKLFALINGGGLLPTDFTFQEEANSISSKEPTTKILYHNSPFSFDVYDSSLGDLIQISFTPGVESLKFSKRYKSDGVWQVVEIYFKEWIKAIKDETTLEDFWERNKNLSKSIFANQEFFNSEEKFTKEEKEDVIERMKSLKEKMRSIPLRPEQL